MEHMRHSSPVPATAGHKPAAAPPAAPPAARRAKGGSCLTSSCRPPAPAGPAAVAAPAASLLGLQAQQQVVVEQPLQQRACAHAQAVAQLVAGAHLSRYSTIRQSSSSPAAPTHDTCPACVDALHAPTCMQSRDALEQYG